MGNYSKAVQVNFPQLTSYQFLESTDSSTYMRWHRKAAFVFGDRQYQTAVSKPVLAPILFCTMIQSPLHERLPFHLCHPSQGNKPHSKASFLWNWRLLLKSQQQEWPLWPSTQDGKGKSRVNITKFMICLNERIVSRKGHLRVDANMLTDNKRTKGKPSTLC